MRRSMLALLTMVALAACDAQSTPAPAPTLAPSLPAPSATAPPPTQTIPPPTVVNSPTDTPPPAPRELTMDDLANMAYQGVYDQPVTLSDGRYEGQPFVEGGASRPTLTLLPDAAFGDLNGDLAPDAAVLLVESSGGSGSFFFLAVVLNQDGVPVNTATLSIGDRVAPERPVIADGHITLDAAAFAETDPLCCPSLRSRTVYVLEDGELVVAGSEILDDASSP